MLNEPSPERTFERPSLPPLPRRKPNHTTEQIDEIINDQIVSTRDGGYQRFLVCWKGLPVNFWIDRVELQWLDPDRLEHYESRGGLYLIGSSFLNPGRMMWTSVQDFGHTLGGVVVFHR